MLPFHFQIASLFRQILSWFPFYRQGEIQRDESSPRSQGWNTSFPIPQCAAYVLVGFSREQKERQSRDLAMVTRSLYLPFSTDTHSKTHSHTPLPSALGDPYLSSLQLPDTHWICRDQPSASSGEVSPLMQVGFPKDKEWSWIRS